MGRLTSSLFPFFPLSTLSPGKHNRTLLRWALLGLLLRLLVMPFTMHTDWRFIGDMVAMNSEAMKILGGQLYPSGGYPPLAYYTMAFFLLLFKPLMPIFPLASMFEPDAVLAWNASPLIFRYTFLLKSWYLLFDFAIAFLLLRLAAPAATSVPFFPLFPSSPLSTSSLRAFAFWMVSPLVLYGPYIHGEFDVVPTFLVTLSLYLARGGRPRWSIFFLGISACYKNWPLFFLPFALFLLSDSWWERAKLFLIGTVPFILTMAPRYLLRSVTVAGEATYYGIYLLPAKLEIGFGQVVYLFIAFYLLILWYVYGKAGELNHQTTDDRLQTTAPTATGGAQRATRNTQYALLWRSMLAVLLLYYPISVAALHYYVWAMPMAALLFAEDRRVGLPYLAALGGILGISISLTRSLAAGLLTPLSPLFFQSLPSPAEIIEPRFAVITLVSLGRTVLAGTAAWLAYRALTGKPREAEDQIA